MSDREQTLKQAQQALQAGKFADGQALADALLEANASDAEALYIAAVSARYQQDFAAAHSYLERLHQHMPEYGRAWQEQGHLDLAQGDNQKALAAFIRATSACACVVMPRSSNQAGANARPV